LRRGTTFRDFLEAGGQCDDDRGHGTVVASLAKRYAPDAEMAIAKVGDLARGVNYNAVVMALDWAAYEWGADVINLSLGFPGRGGCRNGTCALCNLVESSLSRETM